MASLLQCCLHPHPTARMPDGEDLLASGTHQPLQEGHERRIRHCLVCLPLFRTSRDNVEHCNDLVIEPWGQCMAAISQRTACKICSKAVGTMHQYDHRRCNRRIQLGAASYDHVPARPAAREVELSVTQCSVPAHLRRWIDLREPDVADAVLRAEDRVKPTCVFITERPEARLAQCCCGTHNNMLRWRR